MDHHHFFHSPSPSCPQPGVAEILTAIREMEKRLMSAFTDLLTDENTLIAEVQLMVDRLAQVPAEIATAVQGALDAAGVDPTITAAAIAEADASVKAAIAQVTTALGAQAPAAPVVPTVVVTTADTGPPQGQPVVDASPVVDTPPPVDPGAGPLTDSAPVTP